MPADAAPPAIEILQQAMDAAVTRGSFPAAQAAVIVDGELVHSSAHGQIGGADATPDALFDVASVTKIAATTAAIAVLLSRGDLRLDDRVADHVPLFGRNGKDRITVRQLLAHGSGLPAWKPMFLHARADPVASGIYPNTPADPRIGRMRSFERARDIVVDAALTVPQVGSPGERVYSDLGFIALGELVTAVTGIDLDTFCAQEVFAPLDTTATRFFDLRVPIYEARPIAPTGQVRPREPAPGQEALYDVHEQEPELRPGEVDDDNAFAMGGVAGHAGLFSTARDLVRIGWRLYEDLHGAGRIADPEVLAQLVRIDRTTTGAARSLGFDRPAETGSAVGQIFGRAGPRGAIGHLGFTGCSLWIDLDRRCAMALTTNRTRHGREHVEGIRTLRPAMHDLVALVLDDERAAAPTQPGLL